MNRENFLQSSPVQQSLAAGSPNRQWNQMNTKPPPENHHSPPFAATATVLPPIFAYHYEPPSMHSWHDDNQEFDQDSSFSQLLLSGMVGDQEDHKPTLTHVQKVKILENFHQQSANDGSMVESLVKQEALLDNNEFLGIKSTNLSRNKTDETHPLPDSESNIGSGSGSGGAIKKVKVRPSLTQSTFKVKKEKLGDRITALHQMVSPFGKTDTASVLLEVMGYIRFLETQIQALSLPYLSIHSANTTHYKHPDCDEEAKNNLRSRGLCLVPVSCTMQVGNDNGQDYWAQANHLRL